MCGPFLISELFTFHSSLCGGDPCCYTLPSYIHFLFLKYVWTVLGVLWVFFFFPLPYNGYGSCESLFGNFTLILSFKLWVLELPMAP